MVGKLPSQDTCSPWATIADLCSPCDDYAFDTALVERMLVVASTALYHLTRRRYPGVCRETVRPFGGGECFGARRTSCTCDVLSAIRLPSWPIAQVVQVRIDGDTVDPARYRVDNYRELVALDVEGFDRLTWPCCQRMDRAADQDDTFEVVYDFGLMPPEGGVHAAALLACELALAASPETVGACTLGANITSMTREGVSLTMVDPTALFADGRTGIKAVDLWIASELRGIANRPGTARAMGARTRRGRRPCC